jgi:hypothetical protein
VLGPFAAGWGPDEAPRPATKDLRTTSSASLGGTYERPGRLELALEEGTLTMTDVGAGVTIRQDFSATSDGAFRIGAYQAPEQGSFCGPEVSQTASYTWKRSGDVLALAAEHDECADRDAILSGRWKRR